ncbi:MAG TPA: hypothetical protein PKW98_17745 [Candidatus Wallbacteria bacterium]|nr:hypothetical protein [Candidatus Wallbacteria bacterium]
MLSEDILKKIRKKYEKINDIYSKSLEVTLKIFSLLKQDDLKSASMLVEERDSLLLATQNLFDETGDLLNQLFKQEGIAEGGLGCLKSVYAQNVGEINSIKESIKNFITQIKETDTKINEILNQNAKEIKNKISNLKVTKEIEKKYNANKNYQTNFKLLV